MNRIRLRMVPGIEAQVNGVRFHVAESGGKVRLIRQTGAGLTGRNITVLEEREAGTGDYWSGWHDVSPYQFVDGDGCFRLGAVEG